MYQEPYSPEDAFVQRIDTSMEFEVTYWSRKYRVTKAALREVIARVGNRRVDVEQALAGGERLAA